MNKKWITLLFAFVAGIGFVRAEVYSGTCGDNLTWSLNTEDSTLTITGSGDMYNWDWGNSSWYNYRSYIKYLSLPNSVTSIGISAFFECYGLTSVTIPNSVTSIGRDAFYGCSGLTSVNITDLAAWCNLSFATYYSNPLSYAHHLFLNGSEITDLQIPNSVTSIGNSAFSGCSGLTSVTIPNSVTSIGDHAFRGCSGLTSVTIGNSMTSIGDDAFFDCFGLTSVTIPNSVTSIGLNAFYNCSGLTSVNITDLAAWCNLSFAHFYSNPLYYAHHLFLNGSEITDLQIPNSVTSIGDYAFYNCSALTSVTIPNSVTSIGYAAFASCPSLTSIIVENGNAIYDSRNNCNAIILTDLNILVSGCQNTIIPNSVTSIGESAFRNCSGLTSATIPNSVTSIGYGAFYQCSSLETLTCKTTTPPTCESQVFYGVSTNSCILYVPEESISLYQKAEQWKEFPIKALGKEEDALPEVLNTADGQDSKIFLNGQIIIHKNNHLYNAQGQQIE